MFYQIGINVARRLAVVKINYSSIGVLVPVAIRLAVMKINTVT